MVEGAEGPPGPCTAAAAT